MKINQTARIRNEIKGFLNDLDHADRLYEASVTEEQKAGFLRWLENQSKNRAERLGLTVFEFGDLIEAEQTKLDRN